MAVTKIMFLHVDDDGEHEYEMPAHWEICSYCEGTGKSSAYLGAFTAERMQEAGPEFMEDYMNGFYDKRCPDCKGDGKVKVADPEEASVEVSRAWNEKCQSDAEIRADQEAEYKLSGEYLNDLKYGY